MAFGNLKLMDLIEYHDSTGDIMVHRVPEQGSAETKLGSQLIVREDQKAVFFRDGQALDVFGPGRHTLTAANLPILSGLLGKLFDGRSPFRTEVVFVNTKTFTNAKWGTPEPLPFRDKDLKFVRIRAFGAYSMRIIEPQLFVNKVVGSQGRYSREQIEDFLRNLIIARFADFLGEVASKGVSIFDLASNYDEVAIGAKSRVQGDFEKYGLELTDFMINAVSLPEAVQKMIDERASVEAMGGLGGFTQYQAASALRDAAKNEGGGAGAGVGMGAGLGMGLMMPGMINQAMQNATQQPTQNQATIQCPNCHAVIPAKSAFCPSCGKPVQTTKICPHCNSQIPADAKFCPNCGKEVTAQLIKCPHCQKMIPAGSKFCPECGKQI
ncbi:SPFH domain-containing protein [candidate division WOR-3 bacterium]|nr:SPFH domain-containing protein [candidate division WOR-3 bacterium]